MGKGGGIRANSRETLCEQKHAGISEDVVLQALFIISFVSCKLTLRRKTGMPTHGYFFAVSQMKSCKMIYYHYYYSSTFYKEMQIITKI